MDAIIQAINQGFENNALAQDDVLQLYKTLKEKCNSYNLKKNIKVVISYFDFGIPTAILDELQVEHSYDNINREHPVLVNYVENNPNDPDCIDLKVVTVSLYPWEYYKVTENGMGSDIITKYNY